LNLPYTDSEEELELIEEEMPEQATPEETTPGVQSSEHEAPDFQTLEEAPLSPETQDLEVPEVSISKHSESASKKIKKIEEEVMELKLLEKVVKTQNETITRTSSKVRDCFQRLAKMHVKLEKKNKRLLEENKKLHKVARCLKMKLMLKDAKLIAHPGLENLAEVVENLNE
jgi:hypothetical protein